jgi:diguanylate cyclase (GGDEF)-like protein
MNSSTPPFDSAQSDLARVQAKVEAARAVLVRLLQEVVVAEGRLSNNLAGQMLEANERLVVAALRDQDAARAAAQSLTDVTRLAELDPLTGLPNRALLRDRVAQAMAAARRHGSRLALLFLDLDGFKQINDTLGHAAGDQTLREVALRLSQAVRAADTVGRYGGDEFLILLSEVSHAADAAVIAAKLLAVLAEPLQVAGQDMRLTASIGIGIHPDDADTLEALIAQADAAMYLAKRQGRGQFALHSDVAAQQPVRDPVPNQLPNQLPNQVPDQAREQALAAHARRNAQLQAANERLVLAAMDAQALQDAAQRANQRQADFMVAVAEELGNPFAPVRLAAAMVGRDAGGALLLPRVQAFVDQQAAHMARLVAAARAQSRAVGMPAAAGQTASDLVGAIETAVQDAAAVLGLRQQHLSVLMPTGPIRVHGDAATLGHVLGNLLDNASRYTPDGGTIRLDACAQGPSAVLTVSDNGIGLAPALVPEIFEPFGRDSRAIGLHGGSAGIGLPVVRALVTELGGTVAADSAGNGRGSRFVVTLPLAGAAGAPA